MFIRHLCWLENMWIHHKIIIVYAFCRNVPKLYKNCYNKIYDLNAWYFLTYFWYFLQRAYALYAMSVWSTDNNIPHMHGLSHILLLTDLSLGYCVLCYCYAKFLSCWKNTLCVCFVWFCKRYRMRSRIIIVLFNEYTFFLPSMEYSNKMCHILSTVEPFFYHASLISGLK